MAQASTNPTSVRFVGKQSELDFDTLVPGHGGVLKGKAFVQQEIELIEAVIGAMNQEIGRTSANPQTRFARSRKSWSEM